MQKLATCRAGTDVLDVFWLSRPKLSTFSVINFFGTNRISRQPSHKFRLDINYHAQKHASYSARIDVLDDFLVLLAQNINLFQFWSPVSPALAQASDRYELSFLKAGNLLRSYWPNWFLWTRFPQNINFVNIDRLRRQVLHKLFIGMSSQFWKLATCRIHIDGVDSCEQIWPKARIISILIPWVARSRTVA